MLVGDVAPDIGLQSEMNRENVRAEAMQWCDCHRDTVTVTSAYLCECMHVTCVLCFDGQYVHAQAWLLLIVQ